MAHLPKPTKISPSSSSSKTKLMAVKRGIKNLGLVVHAAAVSLLPSSSFQEEAALLHQTHTHTQHVTESNRMSSDQWQNFKSSLSPYFLLLFSLLVIHFFIFFFFRQILNGERERERERERGFGSNANSVAVAVWYKGPFRHEPEQQLSSSRSSRMIKLSAAVFFFFLRRREGIVFSHAMPLLLRTTTRRTST